MRFPKKDKQSKAVKKKNRLFLFLEIVILTVFFAVAVLFSRNAFLESACDFLLSFRSSAAHQRRQAHQNDCKQFGNHFRSDGDENQRNRSQPVPSGNEKQNKTTTTTKNTTTTKTEHDNSAYFSFLVPCSEFCCGGVSHWALHRPDAWEETIAAISTPASRHVLKKKKTEHDNSAHVLRVSGVMVLCVLGMLLLMRSAAFRRRSLRHSFRILSWCKQRYDEITDLLISSSIESYRSSLLSFLGFFSCPIVCKLFRVSVTACLAASDQHLLHYTRIGNSVYIFFRTGISYFSKEETN